MAFRLLHGLCSCRLGGADSGDSSEAQPSFVGSSALKPPAGGSPWRPPFACIFCSSVLGEGLPFEFRLLRMMTQAMRPAIASNRTTPTAAPPAMRAVCFVGSEDEDTTAAVEVAVEESVVWEVCAAPEGFVVVEAAATAFSPENALSVLS